MIRLGGVESRTVIVWTAFVEFPQESVAIQVRATTRVPPQFVVTTSLNETTTELQASCAVAMPVLFVLVLAGHSSVKFGGNVRLGRVVSRTVIVCVPLVLLPQPSAAVQRRRMTDAPPQVLLTLSL
jgi:hypothetical protein